MEAEHQPRVNFSVLVSFSNGFRGFILLLWFSRILFLINFRLNIVIQHDEKPTSIGPQGWGFAQLIFSILPSWCMGLKNIKTHLKPQWRISFCWVFCFFSLWKSRQSNLITIILAEFADPMKSVVYSLHIRLFTIKCSFITCNRYTMCRVLYMISYFLFKGSWHFST